MTTTTRGFITTALVLALVAGMPLLALAMLAGAYAGSAL